jgi:hypothetical protein
MGVVETIALAMGLAWASGINLYATLAMLGIMGATGNMELPPDLVILQDPAVIAAAAFMYCVEFFADKMPGVDTGWDTIHSFIRIPAAAVLAAGAVGDVNPALVLAAAILGGALGATSHTLKAGTRVLINASPEPFTNWGASVTEDLAVFGGVWAAVYHPVPFLGLPGAFPGFPGALRPAGDLAAAQAVARRCRPVRAPGPLARPFQRARTASPGGLCAGRRNRRRRTRRARTATEVLGRGSKAAPTARWRRATRPG